MDNKDSTEEDLLSFDTLDYDEIDRHSSHAQDPPLPPSYYTEEGEVMSDEDGEIKDSTPPRSSHRRRRSSTSERRVEKAESVDVPPTSTSDQKEKHNQNICRHYLLGRCSWGEECRFIHETSTDDRFQRKSHSPVDYSRRHHSPVSYRRDHYPSYPLDPFYHHSKDYTTTYDMLHHHSHFRHPPPPTRYYEGTASPWSHLGGVAPPPPHNGIEKVEESQGWHRLRTITSGWDSDGDDNFDKNQSTNDLRTKLKKKKYYSTSESDSNSSNSDSKSRKLKSKKSNKRKASRSEDEWVDPWSRGKASKAAESSDEDQKERKRKKSNRKEKEHCYLSEEQEMFGCSSGRDKVKKELDRVTRKTEKRKSIQNT